MATGQQIVDRVQATLLDSDAAVWTEAGLLDYLNEVQNDFATKTQCFIQEVSIAVTIPTPEPPEYALPSLCVGLDKVDSVSLATRLDEETTRSLDLFDANWELASAATAMSYVRDRRAAKKIRLYPRPNTPDTLELQYFAVPVAVALSTSSGLPQWMHHWLQFGVIGIASGQESDMQDVGRADHCAKRYEGAVKVVLEILGAS